MTAQTQPQHLAAPKLFDWNSQRLLQATSSLLGQWHEPNLAAIDHINSPFIITDTRKLKSGDLFLAIKGDHFDGHDYLQTAADLGAVAAIVSTPTQADIPQLVVSDTRLALGQLAAFRRRAHPDLTVIALTGSSGKTTCKEMLGSIFERLSPTLITRGNLNNDLGAPMMLLELSDHQRFAVIELGANHVGEIAYCAAIVDPDVACVLNIGSAHLGEFGSRDAICRAKSEIFQTPNHDKVGIVPDNDEFAAALRQTAQQYCRQVIGFGKTQVTASQVQLNAEGSEFVLTINEQSMPVKLPLSGAHNVENALAAAACAHAVGIDIQDIISGLERARPAKGRLVSKAFGQHQLIDDTYNANPHSVRAAAHVLAAQSGHKIMVLGDIAELGDAAAEEHFEVGKAVAQCGVDHFFAVGEFASDSVKGAQSAGLINSAAFSTKAELLNALKHYLQDQASTPDGKPCTILFKGSRTMQMETLIDALVEE